MKNDLFYTLERLANLFRSESKEAMGQLGLQPVHLEALSYLNICNRYSDTPQAVTDYLGSTKGTVSQTLKILESKHLIEKVKDPDDKRVVHLKLTVDGQHCIDNCYPPEGFGKVLEEFDETAATALNKQLKQILASYQSQAGREGFGVCQQCHYNRSTSHGFQCGLTEDVLSEHDATLICREFK
ncbi:MarR family winged helix-turn-helix transcriptional regulator [Echinimonas agarilytica]|uniref:MarR family winged helix-turn-helix transcriptional regulator n=1 Tax=Echinimonas agarilytica TaxID=1215918 RepID=A0AA41W5S2_9GAMM|nr:MarR family winged helix-turn-helix transcriptional regulator [Echinimonas agarilytica]MCM2679549.1 MarR family winged helix-turn-helix transcriptional regulator [Echinimonas agarilytica]